MFCFFIFNHFERGFIIFELIYVQPDAVISLVFREKILTRELLYAVAHVTDNGRL